MSNKLKMINKEKLVKEMIDMLVQKLYINPSNNRFILRTFFLKILENHNI